MSNRTAIWLLALAALLCMPFMTQAEPPVDDVYYWPDAYRTPVTTNSTGKTSSTTSTTSTSKTPSSTTTTTPAAAAVKADTMKVEYVNVQDTTVTIRVKR